MNLGQWKKIEIHPTSCQIENKLFFVSVACQVHIVNDWQLMVCECVCVCVLFSLYNNNPVYLTMMFIKLGFPFLASLQHVVLRLHVYCLINGIKNNLLFVILCKFD